MVKVIGRLPTEKEEMARVRRAVQIAKEFCQSSDEFYYPKKGTWFSIHDNHGDEEMYVYPLERIIQLEKGYERKAVLLGRAFEKEGEGAYNILNR